MRSATNVRTSPRVNVRKVVPSLPNTAKRDLLSIGDLSREDCV
jgi:hypothetical protein